jgi:hypothetical protein
MRYFLTTLIILTVGLALAMPVFAQSNGVFYNDLRQKLGTTSTQSAPAVNGKNVPTPVRQNIPLGTAELGATSSPSVASAANSNAYVAGTDSWSAPIAGVAAVLSVIVIAMIVWFVVGHRHVSENHE